MFNEKDKINKTAIWLFVFDIKARRARKREREKKKKTGYNSEIDG